MITIWNHKNRIWTGIWIALLFAACGTQPVFEQYHAIQDEVWCRNNPAVFEVNIPDSGDYHIELCLRHTTDYEMANLWCFVSTQFPGSKIVKDTVNILVAEPDGRWLGKGGSLKNLEQPLCRESVSLPAGKVTFHIEQAMRFDCMKGIRDVGIKVERISEKEE